MTVHKFREGDAFSNVFFFVSPRRKYRFGLIGVGCLFGGVAGRGGCTSGKINV